MRKITNAALPITLSTCCLTDRKISPPGELVKYFQSIGMKFGPDANASTGFYSTVYDIDLPEKTTPKASQRVLR